MIFSASFLTIRGTCSWVGPLTRYVGCDYITKVHPNGMVTVSTGQPDYIVNLTAAYLEKANKSHLQKVATPLPKEQPPAEDYEIDGRLAKHAAELIGSRSCGLLGALGPTSASPLPSWQDSRLPAAGLSWRTATWSASSRASPAPETKCSPSGSARATS